MPRNINPSLAVQLDQLAADVNSSVFDRPHGSEGCAKAVAFEIGCSLGLVRSLMIHHRSPKNRDSNFAATLSTISTSSAEEYPSAIVTPHSTETKTDAGVTPQVVAQSSPTAPTAQTKKDRAFLRATLLNLATVLLMVVLSLTSTQSLTQMYAAPTVAVMILIISIQLLIAIALFI